jgi:radical SAM superfamily enzyme YgiQ (UPF0313 family)
MKKDLRVLLANLPWYTTKKMGIRAGSRCPAAEVKSNPNARYLNYLPFPFMIGYAAALLEKARIDVKVIDAIAEGFRYEEVIAKAVDYDPDIIVIETSTPTINSDLVMSQRLKEAIGCKIVLCGSHASDLAKEVLSKNKSVDFIMKGEYEETLLELVNTIRLNGHLAKVDGIYYRSKEGIRSTHSRKLIDINTLPFPAWHLMPHKLYKEGFLKRYPQAKIQASRGCPYNCNFCLWGDTMFGGRNYRVRRVKDVVDEAEMLVKRYGMKAIFFDDDTFNIGRQRVMAIFDEIISRKSLRKTQFAFIGRADLVDEEMLDKMKEANFVFVIYGVESGSQALLDECGKDLDVEKARRMVILTKKKGIGVHLTFTVGLYSETWETIEATKRFIEETNPDSIQLQYIMPYPGTRYFDEAEKRGSILTKDWDKYDNLEPVIRTKYMTREDLLKAKRYIYSSWNRHLLLHNFYRPRYILRAVAHPLKALRNAYSTLKAAIGG